LLYNSSYDDTYFVTRFLGGLKDDIRSMITLHRPSTVDTASALALLQEEELAKSKSLFTSKSESRDQHKGVHRAGFSQDKGKPRPELKPVEDPKRPDKLDFLMAYRKEKGLCFKCGDKWSKQHKCSPQVPLHIIEELLEVIDYPDTYESDSDDITTPVGSSLMAIADECSSLTKHRRTMQLRGLIGKQEVLILVDSGSEYSFVSEDMVTKVQCSV